MERKHLQCLKRDACREVNVTDDGVGSTAGWIGTGLQIP